MSHTTKSTLHRWVYDNIIIKLFLEDYDHSLDRDLQATSFFHCTCMTLNFYLYDSFCGDRVGLRRGCMKRSLRWCGTKAAVVWSSTLMPATGISKREVCIQK